MAIILLKVVPCPLPLSPAAGTTSPSLKGDLGGASPCPSQCLHLKCPFAFSFQISTADQIQQDTLKNLSMSWKPSEIWALHPSPVSPMTEIVLSLQIFTWAIILNKSLVVSWKFHIPSIHALALGGTPVGNGFNSFIWKIFNRHLLCTRSIICVKI